MKLLIQNIVKIFLNNMINLWNGRKHFLIKLIPVGIDNIINITKK